MGIPPVCGDGYSDRRYCYIKMARNAIDATSGGRAHTLITICAERLVQQLFLALGKRQI